MRNDLLIESREINDHRIKIYYDIDAGCPVTDWDLGGTYLFEHLENHGYQLSRDCDWKELVSNPRGYSLADLVQRIAAKMIDQKEIIKRLKKGKFKDVRFIYDRHERQWELQTLCDYGFHKGDWVTDIEIEPYQLKQYDYRMELLEPLDKDETISLIKECAKDFVIMEWDSCGYSQGDHMRGVAYMTKDQFDKRCGFNPNKYKDWKEQALSVIEGEIDCINKWAWGDVKGFVLEKKVPFTKVYDDAERDDEKDVEWDMVDSCWGYYMETEELIEEIVAEHNLKEVA